jgi:starch synthase (maltosyl-transferring)
MSVKDAAARAQSAFIVNRDEYKTVIAGYPWFLDWGRDTLIALRGIIAAGRFAEARAILLQFAKFEQHGTLPNMIRGEDHSNRDTSDAPLFFFVAVSDLMNAEGNGSFLDEDEGGRTVREVLLSIVRGYMRGTPNGIHMDSASGLIFSPSHFTWMDTNYPAGTPREGYPVEIQALWIHALKMSAGLDRRAGFASKAEQAARSLRQLFVINDGEEQYLADCLCAAPGQSAKDAVKDDALSPNQLLALTLGAISDHKLCKSVLVALDELLVPGGIRSLADRKVRCERPIWWNNKLLNVPTRPYIGRYIGDEDTRRKPAYHNGTAWTWLFPSYCEAVFATFGESARRAALSLLSSSSMLMNEGCLLHVPEILDGDTPHTERGCGAQAWGATELYRVWKKIEES